VRHEGHASGFGKEVKPEPLRRRAHRIRERANFLEALIGSAKIFSFVRVARAEGCSEPFRQVPCHAPEQRVARHPGLRLLQREVKKVVWTEKLTVGRGDGLVEVERADQRL